MRISNISIALVLFLGRYLLKRASWRKENTRKEAKYSLQLNPSINKRKIVPFQ